MARPKESNEVKVKKVYPDAECINGLKSGSYVSMIMRFPDGVVTSLSNSLATPDLAWADAFNQIRKAKIKAAKDRRKQAQPVKVKEIKQRVHLAIYPSNKDMIVSGFGSVQKFLDSKINEYKLTIKTN